MPYPAGVTPPVTQRRNMTPEEIAALWNEPGITPTLPPLNPMDLAMLGLSGPAESAGLPPTLLQMVRYKRPGVSALAQEAAAAYHQTPRVDPIGAKNTVFHETSPESVERILGAGEIVPDPGQLADSGLRSWQEYTKLRPLEREAQIPTAYLDQAKQLAQQRGIAPGKIKGAYERTSGRESGSVKGGDFGWFLRDLFGEGTDAALAQFGYRQTPEDYAQVRGVSVSRVPRVASKATRAASFVIDPEKMGPSRPFTEPDYQKTKELQNSWFTGEVPMNQQFEFENRTYDTAIPRDAIRELWLDKAAIGADPLYWGSGAERPHDIAERMREIAKQYGIPVREFESGREMHAGRATLSDMAKRKKK